MTPSKPTQRRCHRNSRAHRSLNRRSARIRRHRLLGRRARQPTRTASPRSSSTCPRTSPPGRSASGAWATAPRSARREAEVVTRKNLIVRLQAPRFFVEKDEVVLSANVHNYLQDRQASDSVALELDGDTLELPTARRARQSRFRPAASSASIGASRSSHEGEAVVRMKALTDEESDAMEMKFPVYVHGMLKIESLRRRRSAPTSDSAQFDVTVPARAPRRADAARGPLLADAGRRDGRRPALPGRLSLRLHRADAQPLPADGHHAEDPAAR